MLTRNRQHFFITVGDLLLSKEMNDEECDATLYFLHRRNKASCSNAGRFTEISKKVFKQVQNKRVFLQRPFLVF